MLMLRKLLFFVFVVIFPFITICASAADRQQSKKSVDDELHQLLVKQIELSVARQDAEKLVESSFSDPTLTNPEIEELKGKIALFRNNLAELKNDDTQAGKLVEIQQEIKKTELLIRQKIGELPAVKERVARLEATQTLLRETGQRILELRGENIKAGNNK